MLIVIVKLNDMLSVYVHCVFVLTKFQDYKNNEE